MVSGHFTPQVQEAMTQLGVLLPYREAADVLNKFWKVNPSSVTIQQTTMRHGVIAETLVKEEVERIEKETPTPTVHPEQVLICTDGAFVQTTGGEWVESKTTVIGEIEVQWDAKKRKSVVKTKNLSYFSRVEPAETFSRQVLYEWQRRGGSNAQQVVTVNDGAPWIQAFIDYHCPQAIRVLDMAHAQGYLATIGKELYGAETEQFRDWFQQICQRLREQPPQETIAYLQQQQNEHDPNKENKELGQAINYLSTRVAMLNYPYFHQLQIPTGSGSVESGHKVVMQKRMKQAGMRWSKRHLNPMLTLRNLSCNQRWSEGWQAIYQNRLEAQKKKRLGRVKSIVPPPSPTISAELVNPSEKNPSPSSPKIPIDPKTHPWRNNQWPVCYRY